MELKIKTHYALPCRTEVFTINGKSAEQDDFGDTYDHHKAVDAKVFAIMDNKIIIAEKEIRID